MVLIKIFFKLLRLKFKERIFEDNGAYYRAISGIAKYSNYDFKIFNYEILVPLSYRKRYKINCKDESIYLELVNKNKKICEFDGILENLDEDNAIEMLKKLSKNASKVVIIFDKTMIVDQVYYYYEEFLGDPYNIVIDAEAPLIYDDNKCGKYGLCKERY